MSPLPEDSAPAGPASVSAVGFGEPHQFSVLAKVLGEPCLHFLVSAGAAGEPLQQSGGCSESSQHLLVSTGGSGEFSHLLVHFLLLPRRPLVQLRRLWLPDYCLNLPYLIQRHVHAAVWSTSSSCSMSTSSAPSPATFQAVGWGTSLSWAAFELRFHTVGLLNSLDLLSRSRRLPRSWSSRQALSPAPLPLFMWLAP